MRVKIVILTVFPLIPIWNKFEVTTSIIAQKVKQQLANCIVESYFFWENISKLDGLNLNKHSE